MATDVELPQLGESVTEGTVTAWLVEVGDTVEVDQPLFELSSDKIDTEVPAPVAGTVTEILVEVDETVEVGTVVARISDSEEASGSDEGDTDEGDTESEDEDAETETDDTDDSDDAADSDEADESDEADDVDEADDLDEADDVDEADDLDSPGGGGEAIDVMLPELGESVTEGTITGWLVEVGDDVTEDQPLFELSSDKIDTEVPSPAEGRITEILVQVDETVEVGTVVARISGADGGARVSHADGGEEIDAGEETDTSEETDAERGQGTAGGDEGVPEEEKPETADGDEPAGPTGSDALASPLVRKLAKENDVDLDSLEGSGQGGRITRDDVEAAISSGGAADQESQSSKSDKKKSESKSESNKPQSQPKREQTAKKPAREAGAREQVEDLSRIRQRIADKMLESQREAAQLTTVQEVDVTGLMNARGRHKEEFKKREGVSLSPFAMVAKAALQAMRNHPMVNAFADWDNGKLYKRDYVNLGIAVDTPKGLLVPNVKAADGLTVGGLARGIAEAAQKARGEGGNKLDFSDIEGGTFTLTNTGSVGVLIDTPILNHPEVAILGVGAIKRRPAVIEAADGTESIAIRSMMYLSLTYDHRLLDGADAARYVTEVKTVCETTDWEQELG